MDTDKSRPLRRFSKSFKYPRIVVDGYLYHFHKKCKYHLRWKCNRVFATKCSSVLLTTLDINNLQLLSVDHDHSHSNDMVLINSLKTGMENKIIYYNESVDQMNTLITMKETKVIDQQSGKRLYPYDNKIVFENFIKRAKFNNVVNEYKKTKNKSKPSSNNNDDTSNQIKIKNCINQNNTQLKKYQLSQKKTSTDLKNTDGTNSQISITLQNSNSAIQYQRTPITSVSTTKLSHQNIDIIQQPNNTLILSPKDLKDEGISKLLTKKALETFSGHELPLAQINSNKGTVTISLVKEHNNKTNSSVDPSNVCISKKDSSHGSIKPKKILSSLRDTTSIDNVIKKQTEQNSSTTITPVEFKKPLSNTVYEDNIIDLTDSDYDDNIKNIKFWKPVPLSIPIIPSIPPVPQGTESFSESLVKLPPTPKLIVKFIDLRFNNGQNENILLTWDINSVIDKNTIQSYEIYGFENDLTHTNNLWTLIGEVKALPLPMACILRLRTKRERVNYFSIRAKDIHNNFSLFSIPDYVSYF